MTMRLIKRMLGYSGGLCDQVRAAADDLSSTAKELCERVAIHEKAPDPLGSALSTMWNNHQFQKFPDGAIDAHKIRA